MNVLKKSFGTTAIIATLVIVAWIAVQFGMPSRPAKTDAAPIKEPIVSTTSTPETTKLVASSSASQQASVQSEWEDANATRLKEAKERLPWASEREVKDLISRGLNVENIERGRYRVDNDVSQLIVAVQSFKARYGSYPSGSALQIMRGLTGENDDKLVFIEWPDKHRSSSGEFLDQWGKPYNIKIDNNTITVRSAGPDGLFETKDDTVITK